MSKRRHEDWFVEQDASTDEPVCALCGRLIPRNAKQSKHHLVPKLRGGSQRLTVRLHQICHNEIHSVISEAQLARHYHTPARLLTHPHLKRFVQWVAKKPNDFHARSQRSLRRRKK